MPFLSCLPCFKDRDTRHNTGDELEKPIPVEKIANNSNNSAAKPAILVTTPSNVATVTGDKHKALNDQSTTTDAATYANERQQPSNDQSAPTQALVSNNEKHDQVPPTDPSNVATSNNQKQPETNAAPVPEPNVPAPKESEPTTADSQPTEPNSTYATPPTMADSLKSAASGVTDTVSSGAQQAQSTASAGAEKVSGAVPGTGSGTQDWEAMTEDQKKAAYEALPEGSDDKKLGYYEWVKQGLYHKKENWMPWIEDMYLSWFTKDNKASYATKDAMDKSKITGIDQVDTLQDSVNHTVSSQVGQGGLLQPVGDAVSKEGVNRAERGGKEDDGSSYLGSAGGYVSGAGGSVWSGAKSAGGYVGGMFGGKKEDAPAK